jgi:hypothetical protein
MGYIELALCFHPPITNSTLSDNITASPPSSILVQYCRWSHCHLEISVIRPSSSFLLYPPAHLSTKSSSFHHFISIVHELIILGTHSLFWTLLHHLITLSLHHLTIPSLYRLTTSSPHHFINHINSSQQHFVTSSLHPFTTSPFPSLYRLTTSYTDNFITSSLPRNTTSPLHNFIISPLCNLTTVSPHHHLITSLLRHITDHHNITSSPYHFIIFHFIHSPLHLITSPLHQPQHNCLITSSSDV